jgi:DNA replication protein DnaC
MAASKRRKDIDRRIEASGLPDGYLQLRDSQQKRLALARVRIAFSERSPFALIGPTAVGKTLTLATAVRCLIEAGGSACYRSVARLQQDLRSCVETQRMWLLEKELQFYSTVPNLMLDDIGAQHDSSGWFTSLLYRITDNRMSEGRATWSAMNDETGVDARLLRRLTENALVVKLEGGV